MDLVNAVYDATDGFPKRETYSLTDQIRRAASLSQAISQRDRRTMAIVSFFISFAIRVAHWLNLKPSCRSLSGGITCPNRKRLNCLNEPMKSAAF